MIKMAMQKTILMFLWGNGVIFLMFFNLAMAANYTVGGPSGGWDQTTDLATWASSITFFEGDNLLFQYGSNHDVTEVSRADFNSCNPNNPLQPPFTGGSTVVTLSSSGDRYFICSTPGHCLAGMKLQIHTLASTPTPTPPPTATPSPPPESSHGGHPVSSPPSESVSPSSPSPKVYPSSSQPPEAATGRPASSPATSLPPRNPLLTPAAAPSSTAARFSEMGALTAFSGFLAIIMILNF